MAENKSNKTIWYIIGVIAVIAVLMFVFMKKPAEEPEPAAPVEEPEVEETLPEPEVATEYEGEEEMVKNAVCSDGKIGAVITNVAEETMTVSEDIKFLLRGLVVKEPGCDKEELAPGESTTCTSLNGPFQVVEGKNEVVIRLARAKEGLATVTCSMTEEAAAEE